MLKHTQRRSAGDTIVEVMISLAILGLALGISYSTATGSLRALRQSQESATAASLLQAQAERLRTVAAHGNTGSDSDPNNAFRTTSFCINDSVAAVAATSADCTIKNLYQISITYSAASNDKFTLKAVWPDVSGDGSDDTATLNYRLHDAN